jgi:hypothetical protein
MFQYDMAKGEELGSNLLQVIERTRSGLDRHRLWQQYNGIWISLCPVAPRWEFC